MEFTSIIGFTNAEATSIVSNDTWFEKNRLDDAVQRYIKYETDETGKHVISISRTNTPADGHVKVDKWLCRESIETDTPSKVAAFLFSVNANKGPAVEVKKFFANGGTVSGDTEMAYLGHVAWFVGNNGYGKNTDMLCQYEVFYLDDDIPMLDLATGRDIFCNKLYWAFVEIRKLMETGTVDQKELAPLTAGMEQDIRLVKQFM
jgi:hypothetical protein